MNSGRTGLLFILCGMFSLWLGLIFGSIGAFQFVYPELFDFLPFFKSRPLHVSLVVAWIFLTSIGGIYYYLPKHAGAKLYSEKLASWHLGIFLLTGLVILGSYIFGKFGGREYWEFPPILAIPILISWILFGFNFFKTVYKLKNWPVHYWMWTTGILFFFISFLEANSWIIPYVRGNVVRELTIQWKSYGALVGSWNMLVYGTSIFLMEKISGNPQVSRSRMAFLMYFLGFTNLLFGWAHHTYIIPAAPWVKIVAYSISMTELIILARIIWTWKSTIGTAKQLAHRLPYLFLMACEGWIFINLTLALLISVPAINIYTHGTHITVAHAMGSTIGINTMILLASVFFVLRPTTEVDTDRPKSVIAGYWISNISLLVFFCCLVTAGLIKGKMTIIDQLPHQEIMESITPFIIGFGTAGLGLLTGLSFILHYSSKAILKLVRNEL